MNTTEEVKHERCNRCKCWRLPSLFLNTKGRKLKTCQKCRDLQNAWMRNGSKIECTEEGCSFKCKSNGHLKIHLMHKHNINVKWFECDQEGCSYKCKSNSSLKDHLIHKHGKNVKWIECTEEGCESKFKSNGNLKQHLSRVHDIGVVWHHCTQQNCTSKFKSNGELKYHLIQKHNLNVKWYQCTQANCQSKFKSKSNLKRHLSGFHDIGDFQCPFCCRNVFNLTEYSDHIGNHKICRKCFNKTTGQFISLGVEIVSDCSQRQIILL
jgi:hypothetical protein